MAAGALAAALPACDRAPSTPPGSGAPKATIQVVATTGMLADAAREIAGASANVAALMGPGVDPHLYKASPGDIRQLGAADLIIYNGLHLEGKLADVLERVGKTRKALAAAEQLDHAKLRDTGGNTHDPHVWFDAALWAEVSTAVGGALAEAIPSQADAIRTRTTAYADRLKSLDAWCREQIATIPESHRVLVTSHDAFGYFGRAYGLRVLAIQGISTESEASLKDINALVDTLVAERVPAVFVESSVPPKTIEALIEGATARGQSVKIGGELFSDAMGNDGTPEGTYIGMVRHNVRSIVTALGGKYTEPPETILPAAKGMEPGAR